MLENWATKVTGKFSSRSRRRGGSRTSSRLKAECRRIRSVFLYTNLESLGGQARAGALPAAAEPEEGPGAAQAFLELLPGGHSAAFEFRNETWFDDDVYAGAEGRGRGAVLSEREDRAPPPLVETASWGYVRLRLGGNYIGVRDLAAVGERESRARSRQDTHYAYFMHEPTAPAYARQLMQLTARDEARRRSASMPCRCRRSRSNRTSTMRPFAYAARSSRPFRRDEAHIHVFVGEDQREEALALHPAYVEKLTWGRKVVGLRVTLADAVPHAVLRLVSQAWRNKAPKTLVRQTEIP